MIGHELDSRSNRLRDDRRVNRGHSGRFGVSNPVFMLGVGRAREPQTRTRPNGGRNNYAV